MNILVSSAISLRFPGPANLSAGVSTSLLGHIHNRARAGGRAEKIKKQHVSRKAVYFTTGHRANALRNKETADDLRLLVSASSKSALSLFALLPLFFRHPRHLPFLSSPLGRVQCNNNKTLCECGKGRLVDSERYSATVSDGAAFVQQRRLHSVSQIQILIQITQYYNMAHDRAPQGGSSRPAASYCCRRWE